MLGNSSVPAGVKPTAGGSPGALRVPLTPSPKLVALTWKFNVYVKCVATVVFMFPGVKACFGLQLYLKNCILLFLIYSP